MSALPAYSPAAGATAGGAPDGTAAGFAGAAAVTPVDEGENEVPSLTLSPTLTFRSLIVPAAGDGTSIVALSDSSADQRILGLDRVAGLDEHLDHRNVLEVADIGHAHLERFINARCRAVVRHGRTFAGTAARFLHLLARRTARRRGIGLRPSG